MGLSGREENVSEALGCEGLVCSARVSTTTDPYRPGVLRISQRIPMNQSWKVHPQPLHLAKVFSVKTAAGL